MAFSAIKKSHKKQGFAGYAPMVRPAPQTTADKLIPRNSPLKPATESFKELKNKLRKK